MVRYCKHIAYRFKRLENQVPVASEGVPVASERVPVASERVPVASRQGPTGYEPYRRSCPIGRQSRPLPVLAVANSRGGVHQPLLTVR